MIIEILNIETFELLEDTSTVECLANVCIDNVTKTLIVRPSMALFTREVTDILKILKLEPDSESKVVDKIADFSIFTLK